jgi:hypothetical protein
MLVLLDHLGGVIPSYHHVLFGFHALIPAPHFTLIPSVITLDSDALVGLLPATKNFFYHSIM